MNRLTKHVDKDVSDLAARVVKDWMKHFQTKRDLPMIEVRCDRKTEEMRRNAQKHLSVALKVDVSELASVILTFNNETVALKVDVSELASV